MTLGQNIQNARRAQGLSQEALAEKIGVSRQALGKWEKDTALPGLDNLQALAAALGIGVDALLGAENADPAVPAVTLDALRDLLAARDAEEKRRRRLWGCAGGAAFIVLAGLLAGVALGIICSALMTWAVYFSTSFDLRQLMYWMMGGFGGVDWQQLWLMLALLPVLAWV